MTELEIRAEIVGIVRRHHAAGHFKLFLFGSRATGTTSERADYDIGLESPTPIPSAHLAKMEADLDELPILQKVDLVDFSRVSDDFANVANEGRVILYEQ